MRLSNLPVKRQLMLAFALMAFIVMCVSALALHSLARSSDRFVEYVTGISERERIAVDLRSAAMRRAIAARNLVLVKAADDLERERTAVRAAHQDMQTGLAAMQASLKAAPDAQDRAALARIADVESKYGPVALKVVGLAEQGRHAEAIAMMNDDCRPLLAALLSASTDFIAEVRRQSVASATEAAAEHAVDRGWMVAFSTGAVLVACGLGWMISHLVTAPLKHAVTVAEAVAAGDLRSRIVVDRRDELGQLLGALSRMNGSLAGMVGDLRQSADGIATASCEIASGNQHLSSRTEQQASALQQTAASMQEMTGAVEANAGSSRQASELAASAAQVADHGGQVVREVVSTMGMISEASRRIADIVGVIDSIAFQTNILALNAAVEAARAGEQGRGFAVVAAEVRQLASSSASAAKDIKALIADNVQKVATGSDLAAGAGHTMTELVTQVQQVHELLARINASTHEQSLGISQINQAVATIDEGTQQNAALVEQSSAAAEGLRQQSQGLLAMVARFRVA
ncbi:methyl-accepting chemotaxis protein [Aquincola tertiaricarbonis]|uniref:methyl-accepting chemotaxis protein n=1 Tax=Aquincola tertiaricarbonis TaxID=391953 RepID=UPI002873C7E7|nr:methyl-accepting chemotaxis protein [Aquincola tertiaricarbonis]